MGLGEGWVGKGGYVVVVWHLVSGGGGGGVLPSLNSQPAQGEGKGERGEEGVKCTAKIINGKPWRKDFVASM